MTYQNMSRCASTNNKALVALFLLLSQKPLSQFNCLIGLSLKNGTCSSNFRRQSPKILISQPSNVKHIGLPFNQFGFDFKSGPKPKAGGLFKAADLPL